MPAIDHSLSRRQFVLASAAALAVGVPHRALTAREVVARIGAGDGFRAGDPETVVTGVATTVMATLDVLRRAAAAGQNLIVTLEPTWPTPNDDPAPRAADPVVAAKLALIAERRLVIWRIGDHWRARTPDARPGALARALGWSGAPDADRIVAIPPTTAGAIVAHARARLGARGGLRVVGDPRTPVRRVLLSPGTVDLRDTVRRLPRADLLLAGEPREWEAVEYAFDAVTAGQPKAMLMLGRVVSEEPGMRACADWLRTLVPEVPVRAHAVGDPYWSPVA